jgi:hypothetical protein
MTRTSAPIFGRLPSSCTGAAVFLGRPRGFALAFSLFAAVGETTPCACLWWRLSPCWRLKGGAAHFGH